MLYRLQHPNISRFEAMGEWKGRPYIATEWVDGETLGAFLDRCRAKAADVGSKESPFPDLLWVARLMETLAHAVHFAHEIRPDPKSQPILHTDITPGNIMITPGGDPKLIDFGLAKALESRTVGAGKVEYFSEWSGSGTPPYMAPEQFNPDAKVLGPYTDIWALGVILYELLTLRRPYEAKSFNDLRHQIGDPKFLPPHPKTIRPELETLDRKTTGVHPTLTRIALTCLKPDPVKRYKSAADLAKILGLWIRSHDM